MPLDVKETYASFLIGKDFWRVLFIWTWKRRQRLQLFLSLQQFETSKCIYNTKLDLITDRLPCDRILGLQPEQDRPSRELLVRGELKGRVRRRPRGGELRLRRWEIDLAWRKKKVDKLNYFIPAARPLCTLGRRKWPRLQKSKIVAFGQFIIIVFFHPCRSGWGTWDRR